MTKNILPIIGLVMTIVSCSNPMDKVHEDITQKVRESLKNPKSLVLDSIGTPDTIRVSDVLDAASLNHLAVSTEYTEKAAENSKWFNIFVTYDNKKEQLDEMKINLQVAQTFQDKADSLKAVHDKVKGTPQDTIVKYSFPIYGQASNSYGAQVNLKMCVTTDNKFKNLQVIDLD